MDLKNKVVLAHAGYFNKECQKDYKENSKEVCRVSNTKDYIDIIELDVRKSKDGILYCYHGTLIQYYTNLKISKDFSEIKKRYGADALGEILDVISEEKGIFLDIKDTSITRKDVLDVFLNKKFKEVILGNRSTAYINNQFYDMPKGFVKILNGNIFCNLYNLEKLTNRNYKYFEVVFPFQISREIIESVYKHGLEFRCAGLFFRNKESYWKKINKYNIKHVSSDFI